MSRAESVLVTGAARVLGSARVDRRPGVPAELHGPEEEREQEQAVAAPIEYTRSTSLTLLTSYFLLLTAVREDRQERGCVEPGRLDHEDGAQA